MTENRKDQDTFIIWDGRDTEMFFNILKSALENNPIAVLRSGMESPVTIKTLDDIEHLLTPESECRISWDGEVTEELKSRIITEAVPSVPMKGYLQGKRMRPAFAAELIFKSPAPLQKKSELIAELADHEDLWRDMIDFFRRQKDPARHKRERYEWFLADSLHELNRFVKEALANLQLKKGEIFYLTDAWYDEDYHEEHDTGITAVTSYEAARKAIHREYEYEGWNPETADVWMILDKFVPGENGLMNRTWRYYMIYDKPVYYEKAYPLWKDPHGSQNDCSDRYGKGNGGTLECTVPFPVGSILVIGSFPFSPEKPGVLIENYEEFAEVLCRDENGGWKIANIEHGMEWGGYQPMLSSLYRIELYEGDLMNADKILLEVSRWISGNEEKGHQFWNAFERVNEERADDDLELISLIGRLREVKSE